MLLESVNLDAGLFVQQVDLGADKVLISVAGVVQAIQLYLAPIPSPDTL